MKICFKCGEDKPDNMYHKSKTGRGGYHRQCKTCRSEYSKGRLRKLRHEKGHWVLLLLESAKQRARLKNLEFNIDISDVVIPERCPIFQVVLEKNWGQHGPCSNSPSLDRVDSTRGYVKGNVAVISSRANVIKNSGTALEHRSIADYIDRLSTQ